MQRTERQESQIKKLRNIKRKAVDLLQARQVKTSNLQPGGTMPLVIEPDAVDVDLAEWAATDRNFINQSLLKHGALLFRGFTVDSVPEFETFAGAVCDELFGE